MKNSWCLYSSSSSTQQVKSSGVKYTQFERKAITDTNLLTTLQLLLQYEKEQEKNFSLFAVTYLQKLPQKTGKTWQGLG